MRQSKPDRSGSLHLIVQGRDPKTLPAGIRACKPYLPHDLYRLPGETIQQLANRARFTAVGQGVAVTWFFYPDEVTH